MQYFFLTHLKQLADLWFVLSLALAYITICLYQHSQDKLKQSIVDLNVKFKFLDKTQHVM